MTTVYAWPTTEAFRCTDADFWLEDTDATVRSVLNGGQQTTGIPGAHWMGAVRFPKDNSVRRHELLGFLRGLNGKEHRIALWDLRKFGANGLSGYPAGTINTGGVTVNTTAAQFASTVSLANCGNATTLAACDMFAINGQLIENPELATASAGGVMTVRVPQRLRAKALAGTAVTLIRPTAQFALAGAFHGLRGHAQYEEFAIDLEEIFP